MKKWIARVALIAVALAMVGTAASYVFVDHELSKMYGGQTQVAKADLPDVGLSSYVLTNVNVLAPSADRFVKAQSVLMDGGKILSVGTTPALTEETPSIDGNGMYLVPGFIDSHAHLWESENDLLLYVANGVTQVRDMNSLPVILRWKADIADGRIGPDIFSVAPQFATFGPFEGALVGWTQHKTIVRTEDQVKAKVKSYATEGYDALKASSFLSRENYLALDAAATDNQIPLVGHLPMAISLDDLWASNQSEVAHIEEFVKVLDREFGGYDSETAEDFLNFVRERSNAVADRMVENSISVTSTLALIDSFQEQKSDLSGELRAAALEYENPGIAEGTVITSRGIGWLPDVNIYRWPEEWDAARRARSRIYWQTYSKAQHILFDAFLSRGVPILVGTDSNVPVRVPGFSMHEEMVALQAAQMSPSQILASATALPARFMKTNTGEIQPGFKANLVLLRENPLEDISATDSIEMVILNGRMLSRGDLDAMLQAVRSANDESRNVPVKSPDPE